MNARLATLAGRYARLPRTAPIAGECRESRGMLDAMRRGSGLAAALALLVAGCARLAPQPMPAPAPAAVVPGEAAAGTDLLGVLAYSLSLQGAPYAAGGESPASGFDCSGLVRHVYGQLGIDLPRDTREMAAALPQVSRADLRAGDLVFFNTTGRRSSHVGIYLGDQRFIHAPSRRTGRVLVSSLGAPYWAARLDDQRRPEPGDPQR
jgi:hypothetical protein